MPELEDVYKSLRAAHDAGDVVAAQSSQIMRDNFSLKNSLKKLQLWVRLEKLLKQSLVALAEPCLQQRKVLAS
jgi:hypothetical protein